jgi:hypothetical protein
MFFFQLISMNPRPGKVESAGLSQVSSENGSTLKTLWPTWTQTGRRLDADISDMWQLWQCL